jgi:hypothetical protein
MKKWIYLDDIRTPAQIEGREWIVVRNFYEFVDKIEEIGLDGIDGISFDHDLGPQAMAEYYKNVMPNYSLDYSNIDELTGYHACKWLVDHYYEKNPLRLEMERKEKKEASFSFPVLTVHSANPVGSANIMGYLNNFLKNEAQPQSCVRHFWDLDLTSETI